MLDRRPLRPRLAAPTLRRIATLALARTTGTRLRAIATPGLVAPVPVGHTGHRPNI